MKGFVQGVDRQQGRGKTGSIAPGQMGGHKKAISGDHAVWLSQRIKGGDFAIRGLVAELAGEQPEQSVPVLATPTCKWRRGPLHVLVFRCFRR